MFDLHNGKTLGSRGCCKVNFSDVSSGGEVITMVLRISGGEDAKVEVPFMIFKNRNCAYPINGIPDNIEGVSYRTGPRGWMDQRVFRERIKEPRAIQKDHLNRRRYLFMDNCSGHKITESTQQALHEIITSVLFLPPNATHLCQPLDSFVIQKLKEIWRDLWQAEKKQLTLAENFMDGPNGSGKIRNPWKQFYLELAVRCINKLNTMNNSDGMSHARKAMIRCGMALNITGRWEIEQLSSDLQSIVNC